MIAKRRVPIVLIATLVLCAIGASQAAGNAFPGANGKIAFTTYAGGGELYSMNADGTNVLNLTNNVAPDYNAMWSADGTKIAFDTSRDGNFEIYSMNADGSTPTRLTDDTINGVGDDWSPNWSPDGTKLVFYSDRDDQVDPETYEIYTMNANGTNQTRLTNNTINDFGAQWSPDGTKLVFSSGGTASLTDDPAREIYTMNADGTSVSAPLTNNAFYDDIPSWSPDGTKILFQSNRDGNEEIYSMNANGTNQTNLTQSGAADFFASWSPDGTKIVFGSLRDDPAGFVGRLYTMNADGTFQTRIAGGIVGDQPSWQPVLASAPPITSPLNPAASPTGQRAAALKKCKKKKSKRARTRCKRAANRLPV